MNPFIIFLLIIFLLNLIQIVIHMPLYQLINLLFTLLFEYSLYIAIMETSKYSEVYGHIRGRQIDIEFNEVPNNKSQEIK